MSCDECQVIDGIGIIPVDEISVPPHEFAYCDELNSIVIPKGISVIGESAFEGCVNLRNLKMSDTMLWIGDEAFSGCESLAHIVLPRELHTIGWYAFSDCINLEDIEFPDGLAIIMAILRLVVVVN